MKVNIADLSGHTLTRARGRSAYTNLMRRLGKNKSIQVEIREDRPVSLSFLDELVWRLAKSEIIGQVRFRVAGKDTLRKLSRIAEIRRVDITYVDSDTGATRTVRPLPGHKPVVSTGKAKPFRNLSLGSSDPSS